MCVMHHQYVTLQKITASVCVCACVRVCVCLCAGLCARLCVCMCASLCARLCVYVCAIVCASVCVHVCALVCATVCVCVRVCVCTCVLYLLTTCIVYHRLQQATWTICLWHHKSLMAGGGLPTKTCSAPLGSDALAAWKLVKRAHYSLLVPAFVTEIMS